MAGEESQGPREVLWYLAKAIPDLDRNEPKNIGLVVRLAESEKLAYAFITDPVVLAARGVADVKGCMECVTAWIGTIERHGARCLYWLPKRKHPSYYIELSGRAIKPGRVNIGALYERLVA